MLYLVTSEVYCYILKLDAHNVYNQSFRFAAIGVASTNGGTDGSQRLYFELYARITKKIKDWIKGIAKEAHDSKCQL